MQNGEGNHHADGERSNFHDQSPDWIGCHDNLIDIGEKEDGQAFRQAVLEVRS
jgi:hypothetical protein